MGTVSADEHVYLVEGGPDGRASAPWGGRGSVELSHRKELV